MPVTNRQAAALFQGIWSAPKDAGHFAVFTKQDEFLKDLKAHVLPLIH